MELASELGGGGCVCIDLANSVLVNALRLISKGPAFESGLSPTHEI